jgi:hypothetical protein
MRIVDQGESRPPRFHQTRRLARGLLGALGVAALVVLFLLGRMLFTSILR